MSAGADAAGPGTGEFGNTMVTLNAPIGAKELQSDALGTKTWNRKFERFRELRILSRNVAGWLRDATGRNLFGDMTVLEEEELNTDVEPPWEKKLWQELRRGHVLKEVLLKADSSLELELSKINTKSKFSNFLYKDNLQAILNAAKKLGVTEENKSDATSDDFFSKSRKREALFFFCGLSSAAYKRSMETKGHSLPPPPLHDAEESVNVAIERGTKLIDNKNNIYKALQQVNNPTETDILVLKEMERFPEVLIQKVCDDCYLLDGSVPIFATKMEGLVMTKAEFGWELLRPYMNRYRDLKDAPRPQMRSRSGSRSRLLQRYSLANANETSTSKVHQVIKPRRGSKVKHKKRVSHTKQLPFVNVTQTDSSVKPSTFMKREEQSMELQKLKEKYAALELQLKEQKDISAQSEKERLRNKKLEKELKIHKSREEDFKRIALKCKDLEEQMANLQNTAEQPKILETLNNNPVKEERTLKKKIPQRRICNSFFCVFVNPNVFARGPDGELMKRK